MFSSVMSAAVLGVDAYRVSVEADMANGLPGFSIVGCPSTQVRESQERVRTALKNIGYMLPAKRVTINLAPAGLRKEGTGFDLAVAAAILLADGRIPEDSLRNVMIAGELGLDGQVRKIPGILPMVLLAEESGCRICIVPAENRAEGRRVDGMQIIGIQNLEELIRYCEKKVVPEEKEQESEDIQEKDVDFIDVAGQEMAKRGALLAAAGFHNFLMIGQPGSGKTMIARRIPGILPELAREESLEIMKIQSVAGILSEKGGSGIKRPFRAPHHTLSMQALTGGGRIPIPGEVTLAHRGVLFIDELTEVPKVILETLRQPLEEKEITISRLSGNYRFPANFLFVAAMNSCPCGAYPDMNRCTCTSTQLIQYRNRLSQPILERIDICTEIMPLSYKQLRSREKGRISTKEMRAMVDRARQMQKKRYAKTDIYFNSELSGSAVGEYCILDSGAENLMETAADQFGLSARVCHNMIKTARTAADIEGSEIIRESHIREAILFRSIDKQSWEV